MAITYVWSKLMKKIRMSAIRDSYFEKPSRSEAGSTVIGSRFGWYSYCGYDCTLINCEIGRFCSIADFVRIGTANHPMDWVSTSPAFYRGRDSIPKDLAALDYNYDAKKTTIGNDVWIGERAMIRAGVRIGNGAVIGMGSIVTKDVPSYAVVAGVPARVIRKRFSEETIKRLEESRWWELPLEKLKAYSSEINDVEAFLSRIEGN